MPVKALLNLMVRKPARSFLPEGLRVYAVGDIHGRADLLDDLLDRIAEDEAGRPHLDTALIFLGDLVDRGPESARVVERLLQLSRSGRKVRFLLGNHEEVFIKAVRGDVRALRFFAKIGGTETILSYGITPDEYRALDFPDLLVRLQAVVPEEHVAFLESFERTIVYGDYLFVHAGVRPGVAIEDQKDSDLCWIREEFLEHRDSFGKMVIHGHTVTGDVDLRSNRIGIDTGAYKSGKLTAIGLESDSRWFLTTGD